MSYPTRYILVLISKFSLFCRRRKNWLINFIKHVMICLSNAQNTRLRIMMIWWSFCKKYFKTSFIIQINQFNLIIQKHYLLILRKIYEIDHLYAFLSNIWYFSKIFCSISSLPYFENHIHFLHLLSIVFCGARKNIHARRNPIQKRMVPLLLNFEVTYKMSLILYSMWLSFYAFNLND